MEKGIKKTALHGWHIAQGANMADFGGYEMPLWYSSAKNEHLAVLQQAGIFDTSHMATLLVSGPTPVTYCSTALPITWMLAWVRRKAPDSRPLRIRCLFRREGRGDR